MALTKISRGLLDTGISDSSDATAITIDSSENITVVGSLTIDTGTNGVPTINLSHSNANADNFRIQSGISGVGNSGMSIRDVDASANRLTIDTSGNLHFDSGFGSAGKAYAVRAWVNFDGSGTVSIRESGNVSSITDHGVGQYTCNFSSAMPDGDYVICGSAGHTAEANQISVTQNRGATAPATSSCRISVTYANSYLIDVGQVTAAFIR